MQSTATYLLLLIARLLKSDLRSLMSEDTAASIPFALLSNLVEGSNTTLSIAQKLNCSKQEASRLIKLAEQNGFVNIKPSKKDGRVKIVQLSKAGIALLAGGARHYAVQDKRFEEILGKEGLQSLTKMLLQISEQLKNGSVDD